VRKVHASRHGLAWEVAGRMGTAYCARGSGCAPRSKDFRPVQSAGTDHLARKNFGCPTHRNSQRRPAESWGHCSPLMFSTRLVVGHAGASRLNASNWPGARAFASTHQPVAGQTVQLAAGSVGILHGGNWGSAEALGGPRQHVP
jgi:hypothetical protein